MTRISLGVFRRSGKWLCALGVPFLFALFHLSKARAKEIAFTFDDVPSKSTPFFSASQRSTEYVKKLRQLKIPRVGVFSDPCGKETRFVVEQLKKYHKGGHLIGNHSCSHFNVNQMDVQSFIRDLEKADRILGPFLGVPKLFRFPFLREGDRSEVRDRVREWLKQNRYLNASITVPTLDYTFTQKILEAREKGRKWDEGAVSNLLAKEILDTLEFNDAAALRHLARSPKHVIGLHELDATLMALDEIVDILRAKGWKVIPIDEAYKDPLYSELPKNLLSESGILTQVLFERTGVRYQFSQFEEVVKKLDRLLGL